MRAKRRTEQEQYEIIMECRQSGLSDHQWCLEHDINPGTFYNWVRRFRKQACEFPAPAGKDRFQAIHQEVVKMEIIPDQSLWTVFYRRYCRDHKTHCSNGTSDRTGCSADQ